jgi:hypothetical protein
MSVGLVTPHYSPLKLRGDEEGLCERDYRVMAGGCKKEVFDDYN